MMTVFAGRKESQQSSFAPAATDEQHFIIKVSQKQSELTLG